MQTLYINVCTFRGRSVRIQTTSNQFIAVKPIPKSEILIKLIEVKMKILQKKKKN